MNWRTSLKRTSRKDKIQNWDERKISRRNFHDIFPAESGVFFDLPYHTPYLHF